MLNPQYFQPASSAIAHWLIEKELS